MIDDPDATHAALTDIVKVWNEAPSWEAFRYLAAWQRRTSADLLLNAAELTPLDIARVRGQVQGVADLIAMIEAHAAFLESMQGTYDEEERKQREDAAKRFVRRFLTSSQNEHTSTVR